jgi:hypothetical protein
LGRYLPEGRHRRSRRKDGKPIDARAFDEKASVQGDVNKTAYEFDLEAFREKNNLPPASLPKVIDTIRFRIKQIERERRQSQKIEGEQYPPNGELYGLRIRLRELEQRATTDGALDEKASIAEPPEGGSRVFERSQALGVTKDFFNQYDKITQKKYASDMEHALKRATAEKTREQTKEWKANRKALRVEVADSIKQRPDVAADLFFGSGELYGKKVPLGSVKMDASKLTMCRRQRCRGGIMANTVSLLTMWLACLGMVAAILWLRR